MLRNTQFFLHYCPELPKQSKQPRQKNACSNMWLIDQLYIKLGYLSYCDKFSIHKMTSSTNFFCALQHMLRSRVYMIVGFPEIAGLVLEFEMWKHFDTKQKSKSFTLFGLIFFSSEIGGWSFLSRKNICKKFIKVKVSVGCMVWAWC